MSTKTTVKGNKRPFSASTPANAISFLVQNQLHEDLNSVEVVKVVAVDAGGPRSAAGYVDVLPLVCRVDTYDNIVPTTTMYRLPYSRIQGGVAALVIDPEPGDVGLAVFTKLDSTTVAAGQNEPVRPGSFRMFDRANGFYVGGFLNKPPEIWLELKQNKEAVLHAPAKVTVNTKVAEIHASEKTVINTPETTCTGNLMVKGNLTWGGLGRGEGGGPARFEGGISNTGGMTRSNGVTVETHTHGGVRGGDSNTAKPNAG